MIDETNSKFIKRYRTYRDLDLQAMSGKTLLMRVDFNVPLSKEQKITDDFRIKQSTNFIRTLQSFNLKIVLISHLGRPKGKIVKTLTLKPIAERLAFLIGSPVKFIEQWRGEEVKKTAARLEPGEILMLENIRFDIGEYDNDIELSREFAELADFFIFDAFGTSHRLHASTVGITQFIPAYFGMQVVRELIIFEKLLNHPVHPFVVVMGGAKVSEKIRMIQELIMKADMVIVGGALAFTFLKAQGVNIGSSLFDQSFLEYAKQILSDKERKAKIILPLDFTVTDSLKQPSFVHNDVPVGHFSDNVLGVDIGSRTVALFEKHLEKAGTVFWNGPMGAFEHLPFSKGTRNIGSYISTLKAVTIVGGGDSVLSLTDSVDLAKFNHVSSAGGAALQLIETGGLSVLSSYQKEKLLTKTEVMHKTST